MERSSFCGRDKRREVRKIFAGPGVYICDVCIRVCHDMMLKDAGTDFKATTAPVLGLLTPQEIKQLYAATDESPFGIRDRAMLSVYYGCGLRKTEGVELDLSDVLSERQILYIRKTKNSYERYVPITTTCLKHIEQYIYNSRPLFLADQSPLSTGRAVGGEAETALFISERGTRISKQIFYLRLKVLCKTAGTDKEIGVHNLWHSIATHLMQQGMELENIGLFLGHRCLDRTQLYTHLINETN